MLTSKLKSNRGLSFITTSNMNLIMIIFSISFFLLKLNYNLTLMHYSKNENEFTFKEISIWFRISVKTISSIEKKNKSHTRTFL